ncbi:hypothetical protein QJS10_CPB13g00497 [Acorus calamus]|uniref:Uncharacterized protein n=1 Tax=Acorus calamus TaxID=4465 RepID=A0AAV9DF99_ACOCL|nr:hypothetical protein QJS10_CPB13g00497 [Acorus calamus]
MEGRGTAVKPSRSDEVLEADLQQKLSDGTAVEVQEEFVETEYYKRLNSIDKQHHTTGKGFIAVEEVADSPKFQIGEVEGIKVVEKTTVFKSNPATNDWIPSSESDEDKKQEDIKHDIPSILDKLPLGALRTLQ